MVGKYFYRKKLSSCDIFIVRLCQAWLSFICAHPWPRKVLDNPPPPPQVVKRSWITVITIKYLEIRGEFLYL